MISKCHVLTKCKLRAKSEKKKIHKGTRPKAERHTNK